MSETKPQHKPKLDLDPHDPRVTAAIIKRIKEMPFDELQAMMAHRSEGVIEREFPDPTPVTREELLSRNRK